MSRQGHLIGSTKGEISIWIVPAGRFVKGFSYEMKIMLYQSIRSHEAITPLIPWDDILHQEISPLRFGGNAPPELRSK